MADQPDPESLRIQFSYKEARVLGINGKSIEGVRRVFVRHSRRIQWDSSYASTTGAWGNDFQNRTAWVDFENTAEGQKNATEFMRKIGSAIGIETI